MYKLIQVACILLAAVGVWNKDYAMSSMFMSIATYILFYSIAVEANDQDE
jgi:hypothetical membrane protein